MIQKLNKILNIAVNVLMLLSHIVSISLIIISGDIFPSLITLILNRLRLDLRLFDIELIVELFPFRIDKKEGGLYD